MAVKKLIEVALPLDAINAASAREKSIRRGHPSTLHMWWARRPLAAARAVIWASLVDDPSSHPSEFPTEKEQAAERNRLFKILEELVVWENSNDERVLSVAREEIRRSMGSDEISLLDPFAGGGAIPLEAQRLGLKSYAQDLNPIAVMINKAMIDVPERFMNLPAVNPPEQARRLINSWEGSNGLSSDVEYYGKWLRDKAWESIGDSYPSLRVENKEIVPVAWIWARTVRCPNPACGCEMPLVRSFDLMKKKGNEYHVEPSYRDKSISFRVVSGKSPIPGTMSRRGGVCPHCGSPVSFEYIRTEGCSNRINYRMMAVIGEGSRKKLYLDADEEQQIAASVPKPDDYPSGDLAFFPGCLNTVVYGLDEFNKLFTNRQLTALCVFSNYVKDAQELAERDAIKAGMSNDGIGLADGGCGAHAYGEAVGIYLAFAVDKAANLWSTICSWMNDRGALRETFARQAIPMVWDFAEANPFSNSGGSFSMFVKRIADAVASFPTTSILPGEARQHDAQTEYNLTNLVISTDPPYYNNIDYSDISDYFYVWMRKALRDTYPQLFSTLLTPKNEELIAMPYRQNRGLDGARNFFEEGMFRSFQQVNLSSRDDVPVTIYYAFKQSDTETVNEVESTASTGWETMLSAIIRAGFTITGTWPVRTESPGRAVSQGQNALASSIVLVCRKRSKNTPSTTRRQFVQTLKRELAPALNTLQSSSLAPVDLAQSAIGPGIGVYSRFSKVLEADGSEMTVRSALQIINQELDLFFSDQDSDLDRESRFCVDLYTQNAFNEIRFGEADVLARAKNTSIEGIAGKGALSSAKGVVRLLDRDELRDMPNPDFCWLFTQQLTYAMETGGIEACAKMLKDIFDGRADNARALAYRLFTIADKKGWNQEAFAYNSLVVAWRDIESRAAQLKQETPVQTALDI